MRRKLTALVLVALAIYGGYRIWKHWSYGGFRYVSCTISFADDYGYLPAKGPARFRAYIIAGLNDSWQHFAASEVNKPWLGGLQAMGGDIVIIGLPAPPPCWFKNGGHAYRAAFLAKFARIKGLAENTYGNPPQALVVGISYGGLHALYIYLPSHVHI